MEIFFPSFSSNITLCSMTPQCFVESTSALNTWGSKSSKQIVSCCQQSMSLVSGREQPNLHFESSTQKKMLRKGNTQVVLVPISITFLASHFNLFALSHCICKMLYLWDAWVFKTLTAFWHLGCSCLGGHDSHRNGRQQQGFWAVGWGTAALHPAGCLTCV